MGDKLHHCGHTTWHCCHSAISLTLCNTKTGSISPANTKCRQKLDKVSVYFAVYLIDILTSCLLFQTPFTTTIPHENLCKLHPLPVQTTSPPCTNYIPYLCKLHPLPVQTTSPTCTNYIPYPPYPIYRLCPFSSPKFHHRNVRRTT